MASSFLSKDVFGTQSNIQGGAFVKKVNGFEYFYKKAKCLTGV